MLQAMRALAASPDGLGYLIPTQATTLYHMQPLEGRVLPIEPKDTSTSAAAQSAGISLLLASIGIALGLAAGGIQGAGAGLLGAGALSNGYRAQKWLDSSEPTKKHEAIVSLTFAVLEGAGSIYLGYRAHKDKRGARS